MSFDSERLSSAGLLKACSNQMTSKAPKFDLSVCCFPRGYPNKARLHALAPSKVNRCSIIVQPYSLGRVGYDLSLKTKAKLVPHA